MTRLMAVSERRTLLSKPLAKHCSDMVRQQFQKHLHHFEKGILKNRRFIFLHLPISPTFVTIPIKSLQHVNNTGSYVIGKRSILECILLRGLFVSVPIRNRYKNGG